MNTQTTCPRCSGKGHINAYGHIADGVCFKCGGSGTVKATTPRKSNANPNREAIMAENARKTAIAKVQLANHPRLTVAPDHEYYNQHVVQLAQYLNIWNSL